MKRMPKGRGRRRNRSGAGSSSGVEKSERFVMDKCSIWASRIIRRFDILDDETLTLVKWALGPAGTNEIASFITTELMMRDEDELEEWFEKCLDDPDEFAERGAHVLARIGKGARSKIQRRICDALEEGAKRLDHRGRSATEKNFHAFQEMFALTEQETELCLFLFLISAWSAAERYFDDHLDCTKLSGRKYLLAALKMGESQLDEILNGKLAEIEIIESSFFSFSLNDEYMHFIQRPSGPVAHKEFFLRIEPGGIPLGHHFVPEEETKHVLQLFRARPKTSTHILLYGEPGSGKSSYARGLASALGLPAYEIVKGDEENSASKRRAAILACLNMTNSGKGSLVVVDEADHLLNTEDLWFLRGETLDKAWLNHLLEKPGTRMIWITNRIRGMDSSVVRRFAYSLHFRSFNQRQRVRVWDNILRRHRIRRLFSNGDIEALAGRYEVSAGAMDLAVEKSLQMKTRDRGRIHKAVAMGLEAHRTLLNHGLKVRDKDGIETKYSLEGLNIQGDLDAMLRQLDEFDSYLRRSPDEGNRNMNLLFHGPPGTGKSELARYIATRLNRKVLTKRASDLLSPYVGETEQNIAAAFAEAEREEVVLVIDEADSMIFSRGQAVRSWEISHTNEFLAQMERYRGILICTTNLLQDVDSASIRRFNHKVRFGFLRPEGNEIFYQRLLAPLAPSPLGEQVRSQLLALTDLAPGDFRVVRDRFSFLPPREASHERMLEALREEIAVKRLQSGKKDLGF